MYSLLSVVNRFIAHRSEHIMYVYQCLCKWNINRIGDLLKSLCTREHFHSKWTIAHYSLFSLGESGFCLYAKILKQDPPSGRGTEQIVPMDHGVLYRNCLILYKAASVMSED